MTEALITKYVVGALLALLCVVAFMGIRLFARRRRRWAHSIPVHIAEFAVLCALVLVLKSYALMLIEDFEPSFIKPGTVELIAVLAIGIIAMRQLFMLISRLERRQVDKGSDPTSAKVISRTLKTAVFVFLVLMFGDRLGFSLSGLLAFGGIGGIAIGLAGKDILSNFFSGVMLYFDRPFGIGDWIRSPDRNIEGSVVEVGWRITKIRTFDNRPLYVPNSLFASISVENPGRMVNRRITATIGLRYDDADKIAVVVQDIRTMIEQHPEIDTSDSILVYFDTFADSSLNIMVYCFTRTTVWAQWLAAKQDIFLKIIEIVKRHDADFAYPTQRLFMEGANGAQSRQIGADAG